MESPEQWVFAYQHNVFDVGNFDKVDGHNHYNMVPDNRFGNYSLLLPVNDVNS